MNELEPETSVRVGVDIGGTFTDVIAIDEQSGRVFTTKVPTTPDDFSRGAIDGIQTLLADADIDESAVSSLSHGTTVATNALVEREGVSTGLVTTEGFRDVIAIGREKRSELYNLSPEKVPTFTDRENRLGISERMSAEGEVLSRLDDEEVHQIGQSLEESDVDSIGISLMHSYANDKHEQRVATIFEDYDFDAYRSSQLMPEINEYERTLTTIINAYVAPLVEAYIDRFETGLDDLGIDEPLHLMQANGGVIPSDAVDGRQIRLINSGPAAGVLGAKSLAANAGFNDIITLDMGGTTTDTCIVKDEAIEMTTEGEIESVPLPFQQIDIRAVGAGGGSIAWVDDAGVLKVGPQSAGADPGPACYGNGGESPTVTDAAVILGYLNLETIGDGMALDVDAAHDALEPLANQLDMGILELADGILRVVSTNMAHGIRMVTVEKGYDPREFCLTCYGGAGPLFASRLADVLNIERVLVPANPGVLSAHGLVTADKRYDFSLSRPLHLTDNPTRRIERIYADLEQRAADSLSEVSLADAAVRRSVDLRYAGQTSILNVEVPDLARSGESVESLLNSFHSRYEEVYDQCDPDRTVEALTWRLEYVDGTTEIRPPATGTDQTVEGAFRREQEVSKPSEEATYSVYDRSLLPADITLSGPAILESGQSTTVVEAGWTVEVDELGNVLLTSEQ